VHLVKHLLNLHDVLRSYHGLCHDHNDLRLPGLHDHKRLFWLKRGHHDDWRGLLNLALLERHVDRLVLQLAALAVPV
jgi:hypothetical protein